MQKSTQNFSLAVVLQKIKQPYFLFLGLTVLVIGIVYGAHFSPALYYDDWGQYAYGFFSDNLLWFIPHFVRPLSSATYRLQTELFGFNLPVLMIIRIVMLCIQGLLFYVILGKLRVFSPMVNFLCSVIIIVAPVDMTRMWLLMDPLCLIFVQLYVLLLILFVERKSIPTFVSGILLGFLTLLYYEAQLGLILLFPLFYFLYMRIRTKRNYWLLFLPFALGLMYLLFRGLGPLLGIESFHSSQSLSVIYLLRQIRNAIVCLFSGWYLPFSMDEGIRIAALVGIAVSFLFYLFHIVKFGFINNINDPDHLFNCPFRDRHCFLVGWIFPVGCLWRSLLHPLVFFTSS
ncbi:MAG: hypothetical protein AB9891_09965 [Anaerolineaceae bacterium]